MTQPLILAIDTSCDETCAAVTCGQTILSNVISSQINIHAPYGGVVPHLAKRAHLEKIAPVVKQALKQAKMQASKFQERKMSGETPMYPSEESQTIEHLEISFADALDCIAVTIGPGLAPALEVGVNFAKNLSQKFKKPLISINHMEGHLLSALAERNTPGVNSMDVQFPALGLLVSGGHTQLVLVKTIGHYRLLGETLDDAAGEALDKLAKMLKLGYPGGPIIEQLAKLGNPDSIPLPIPLQHTQDLNFSFSGLKTAALYLIQKQKNISKQFTYNLCASFQQAIAKSLTSKLQKALNQYQPTSILLGGGVFANLYFRSQIRAIAKEYSLALYLPYSKKLFTDNAAMICLPAYYKFLKKEFVKNISALDRQPSLNFANQL